MRPGPVSRRAALAGLLAAPALAQAGRRFTDATVRQALLPGSVSRVFPAGPPAAVLLYSLAPDLMAGWPGHPPGPAERAFLAPAAAALPAIGRLTGRDNGAGIAALAAQRPDLVLDYGSIGPAYVALADEVRARTGLPMLLLDGLVAKIPDTYRLLGDILGRHDAADHRAGAAERILAGAARSAATLRAAGPPRVLSVRGPRGAEAALAGSAATEALALVGAETVPPAAPGGGAFAAISPEQALAAEPDWIIGTDPAFADFARADPVWRTLKAVREGRLVLAPSRPFGWLEGPPSVNRLLGLSWLPVLFGLAPADRLVDHLLDLHEMLFHRRPERMAIEALLRPALPGQVG